MVKKILIYAFSILMASGSFVSQTSASDSFDCPCPQVIAHRGASGDYPQSTELAFQRAMEMGSDVLELDIHLSNDGYLIINHDSDFSSTVGNSGQIEDMTLAQIKQLDAGYLFTKDDGDTYPYRGTGLEFLTLTEMTDLFPGVRLEVEMKANDDDLAEALWEVIQTFHLQGSIVVVSQHTGVINHFRDIADDVYTGATIAEQVAASFAYGLGFGWTYRPKYDVIQMPYEVISRGFVEFFKDKGVFVHVWTVNDVSDIRRSLDLGVEGVIGDYPDRIYSVLEERGDR
ncbi:MAG: glycerophosphodiester phosphodiesterase [Desulfobacteraceae bacterium]|nr:glycerophosphodiester phosphodiesterase [Desulfobacteraceae bacterium]